jgi:hypothetical protein
MSFYSPGSSFTAKSGFGTRKRPTPGASTNHKGQDYAAKTGTDIPVAEDGKVVKVGEQKDSKGNVVGWGKYVVVEHYDANGNVVGYTLYAHMSEQTVKAGDLVTKGDKIGEVGNTGTSTGPHLHFEIRPIDPNNPPPDKNKNEKADWWETPPVDPNTFPGFGGPFDSLLGAALEMKDALLNTLNNVLNTIRSLFTKATTTTSPISLDLDNDGIETTAIGDGAYFDHNGNGFAEQTGWAASDDGILVRDINGNGTIDNGTELFGNETILNNGSKASNGFQALSELDDNKDGKIDSSDAAFSQLKIWKDVNSDGISTQAKGYRQKGKYEIYSEQYKTAAMAA